MVDMSNLAFPRPTPKDKKRTSLSGQGKRRATGNEYRDRSIAQEDRVAAEMTATTGIPFVRRPMSGGNKLKPGDVVTLSRVRLPAHKWLMELKMIAKMTTGKAAKKVMSIEWDWLVQTIREATEEHSLPALLFSYPEEPQEFVILRKEDFQRLLKEHHEMTEFIDK